MIEFNKFLFVTVQQSHLLHTKPHLAGFRSVLEPIKDPEWVIVILGPYPGLARPQDHSLMSRTLEEFSRNQ